MKRVTGIGGLFFKCKDPKAMKEWYSKHLGLNTDEYGTVFDWSGNSSSGGKGFTQWTPFNLDSDYFGREEQQFMVNFRVADIENLINVLNEEGVKVVGEITSYDYGKFAHVLDLEGNRVELWEPVDEVFENYINGRT